MLKSKVESNLIQRIIKYCVKFLTFPDSCIESLYIYIYMLMYQIASFNYEVYTYMYR